MSFSFICIHTFAVLYCYISHCKYRFSIQFYYNFDSHMICTDLKELYEKEKRAREWKRSARARRRTKQGDRLCVNDVRVLFPSNILFFSPYW